MTFNHGSERASGRKLQLTVVADTGRNIGGVAIPDDAHPQIKTIFEHWQSMAPGDGLPARRHFDPADVPRLLPNIWLIDFHREPLRFSRRLVGSKIEEFAGKSLQGGWVGDRLDEQRLSSVTRHLTDVVESGKPSWRRGKPLIEYRKVHREIERLYLPLASGGETVDMILALSVFHETMRAAHHNAMLCVQGHSAGSVSNGSHPNGALRHESMVRALPIY